MKKCILIVIGLGLVISLFLLFRKEEEIFKIEFLENEFNYGDNIYLEDVIKNKDIDFDNIKIDTSVIGDNSVEFNYFGNESYIFDYQVKDIEKPLIYGKDKYYVEVNEEFILDEVIIFADNEDGEVLYNIEGNYDTSVIGSYPVRITAIDNYGNSSELNTVVEVILEKDTYSLPEVDYFDVVNVHKSENTLVGIDVSKWQADVDWVEVKNAGIDFVILRIGLGHSNGEHIIDSYFLDNFAKVRELGIPVGVYYYSYASNEEEAAQQARWIIDILDGTELEMPIVFDWEVWNKFNEYKLSLFDLDNIARSFLDTVEEAGYEGMNYGSANYLRNFFNLDEYKTWLAHYTDETNYEDDYYMWQLTDKGIVPGVDGYCDINVLYK